MLLGHMVTKNEANRYLEKSITALLGWVDDLYILDDNSDDATVEIARDLGAKVSVRPDNVPSFMEHEGLFRQYAWSTISATAGDWILCMDADEFLTDDPRPHANGMCKTFKVREVFGVENGAPKVRVDGYWDQITALRLTPWTDRPFPDKRMGCGSVPEIYAQSCSVTLETPQILHYGYAVFEDRLMKYNRYRKLPGHNPRHIDSIIKEPTLKEV